MDSRIAGKRHHHHHHHIVEDSLSSSSSSSLSSSESSFTPFFTTTDEPNANNFYRASILTKNSNNLRRHDCDDDSDDDAYSYASSRSNESSLRSLRSASSNNLNERAYYTANRNNKNRISSSYSQNNNHHHRHHEYDDYDDSNEKENDDFEPDEDNKRMSYCYLCSIQAHVHKKTEPVPVNKRRYLKPYLNPMQLIKKYEHYQNNLGIKATYKFSIKTGRGTTAGTNSNVWFKIFGTAGTWENTEIRSPKLSKEMKFPQDSLVEIELEGPIIGDLKKLKIWHDGKSVKDGWYLEYVEITSYKLEQTYRFVCDQWLSTNRPPNFSNSIILSLHNNIVNNDKFQNSTEYIVLFKTSDKPLMGKSDTNVQFQFVGAKGQSPVFSLLTPYSTLFDKHQLDAFLIMSSVDLGKPEKLRLAHNVRPESSRSSKAPESWTMDFIKVFYSKDPNKFYSFKVDKWVDKNQKMNAIISPDAVTQIDSNNQDSTPGKMIYYISTITGSQKLSGTDAKVFIELKGTRGITSIHRLHNSKAKREFERGQMDHFHIFDINIGEIKAIRIFHDNSGVAPGWFLDAVLIRSMATTLTGKKEKHDSDLRNELDLIRKKYKIRELKWDDGSASRSEKSKTAIRYVKSRSKSAELLKAREAKMKLLKQNQNQPRSLSADHKLLPSNDIDAVGDSKQHKINFNDLLRKNMDKKASLEASRASPSILKTPNSPRSSRNEMMRKKVQFNSKAMYDDDVKSKEDSKEDAKSKSAAAPKVEMNLNWILSLSYDQADSIKNIKTIENFDKSLKSISSTSVAKYDEQMLAASKKQQFHKSIDQQLSEEAQNIQREKAEIEKFIYVFECKKWLAKDMEDRRIERTLKVTNILKAK